LAIFANIFLSCQRILGNQYPMPRGINSNNTPLQQQQETAAAPPQDPHPRQQPL